MIIYSLASVAEFVKISSHFLVAVKNPSRMLETIHMGINNNTGDVLPLGECTGKPCVQKGMQLQLSQLNKDLERFLNILKYCLREMQRIKSIKKLINEVTVFSLYKK